MDVFQKDFSDDSLMVDNNTSVGPALTSNDDSPYLTMDTRDERRDEEPPTTSPLVDIVESSSPSITTSSQQQTAPTPITTIDGDDGAATSAHPNGPTLSEAEAYADNLAREIVNNSVSSSGNATTSVTATEQPEAAIAPTEANTNTSTSNIRDETHYEETQEETAEAAGQRDEEEEEEEADLISVNTPPKTQAPATTMEFTKNYSDDLLMGQNEGGNGQGQGESHTTNADLADYELPPYSGSGSSSGSSAGNNDPLATSTSSSSRHNQQSSSPTRRGSGNGGQKAQSQPATSNSQVGSSSSPSLTALRDLLKTNYSRVSHVFLWQKPIESGVCFGIGLSLIIALTFFSIISVVAYSTLGLVLASGSIRLYKTVMKTLNRSTDTPVDHIWNKVQALNVSMSHEKMHELVDSSLGNLNASLVYFKQVLLAEDKMATIKFVAFVYLLTYIGAWFNGLTLITICFLGLFSVPILYEKNNTKIDEYLNLATGHLSSATSMITNKVGSLVSGSTAAATGADKKRD